MEKEAVHEDTVLVEESVMPGVTPLAEVLTMSNSAELRGEIQNVLLNISRGTQFWVRVLWTTAWLVLEATIEIVPRVVKTGITETVSKGPSLVRTTCDYVVQGARNGLENAPRVVRIVCERGRAWAHYFFQTIRVWAPLGVRWVYRVSTDLVLLIFTTVTKGRIPASYLHQVHALLGRCRQTRCYNSLMSRFRLPRRNLQIIYVAVLCSVAVTILLTYYYADRGSFKTSQVSSLKDGDIESNVRDGIHGEHGHGLKKISFWGESKKEGNVETWSHSLSAKAKNVIGLLSKEFNEDEHGSMFSAALIDRQIGVLTEAMLSEDTMVPKLDENPQCMGDIQEGEVEDLFCLPKPKYLSHIKNPCWYDKEEDGETLKCLPYFHLLGVAKSGTTDLWNRLMAHPHFLSNDGLLHKEGLWWSWNRYGVSGYKYRKPLDFSWYVNIFKPAAKQIEKSLEKETLYHQILITGDASPPDFWDFRGWRNISQNRGLEKPKVITPHLMKHMYKSPKFILIFKDPIDRLYSDYFFVGGGLTSLDFHNDLLASIDMLASCVQLLGLQKCFFDSKLYQRLPVRLPFACYSVWMREWLQVFPLESFLFLKTEEYDAEPEKTLRQVIEFLGMVPLKEKTLEEIAEEERSRITVQKHIAGPMKNETKLILEKLLGPCNLELARLLKTDKFKWGAS